MPEQGGPEMGQSNQGEKEEAECVRRDVGAGVGVTKTAEQNEKS